MAKSEGSLFSEHSESERSNTRCVVYSTCLRGRGYLAKSEGSLFSELRSCIKVEVDIPGSPCLTVRTVSVDVKQH